IALLHPSPGTSCSTLYSSYGDHRHLHSFPTRRSSDLEDIFLPWYKTQVKGRTYDNRLPTVRKHFTFFDNLITTEITPIHVVIKRSEEHTSELQSRFDLVCRLLLEKKKQILIYLAKSRY